MFSTATAPAPSSNHTASAILLAAIPYAAVVTGLYVVRNAWVAILLYHAGIVAVLAGEGRTRTLRSTRSGWERRAIVPACVVAALGGVALYLLWPVVGLGKEGLANALSEYGLGESRWVLFAAYYATAHPVLEELFWRGRLGSRRFEPAWPDAAFGGYHFLVLVLFVELPWALASAAILSVAAWAWRYAAGRFGGLGIPLVSHAVADLSIVLAITAIAAPG